MRDSKEQSEDQTKSVPMAGDGTQVAPAQKKATNWYGQSKAPQEEYIENEGESRTTGQPVKSNEEK